jgi:hypothetical protein
MWSLTSAGSLIFASARDAEKTTTGTNKGASLMTEEAE